MDLRWRTSAYTSERSLFVARAMHGILRSYTRGIPDDIFNAVRLKLVLPVFVYAVKLMFMLPVQVSAVEESSIWRDLHLDDAEGTDCLPIATIFEELARMSSVVLWLHVDQILATNQKFNLSKYIFDAMVKHLDGGVKFLMYPRFLQVFINQQLGNMSTHKKIFVNPFHTKKVFANMKRAGKDFSRRITPLFDTIMVKATEEVGEDLDHPTDSTQIPIIDNPFFMRPNPKRNNHPRRLTDRRQRFLKMRQIMRKVYLHLPMIHNLVQRMLQAKEIAALKKRIQRLERKKMSRPAGLKRLRKLGMSRRVKSSEDQESLGAPENASKQGRSIADIDADNDVTLVDETQERHDDDLNIKAAKPKVVTTAATTTTTIRPKARGVVVQEPSEFRVPQETQPSSSKDKGKGIMIEPKVPLKRKDQIALDEQIARDIQAKLDAELIEEQKLARKQEEEANIALIESWENTQAMMEADRLLAERLQSKEREELTDEEKAKLLAQQKRNRPPTKAQKRTQMSTYLKHMGGYTFKQLKGKSFDEIQKLFDKEMKRVNTFMAMGSKVQESKENKVEGSEETAKGSRKKMHGRKRAGKEQQQKSSKKQKVKEEKESDTVDEYDEAELKKLLVIKKDVDIAIDAIPLATKLPVLTDYKLHKEGMLVHYQLIRADGSSKRYSSMMRMLQGIDKEDLEALWRIVKAKYGDKRPKNEFERVLWGDLKVMFEPDKKSDVWRMLQGYMVTIWKLIDSFGVHFVRRNLKIQKMNIKFRGGLLGLKRLHGFLEVTAAQEQIYEDDLEAMDLKWQLSLLSMRTKKYYQRTGKKIFINGNDIAGYDKSKVKCYNCHKLGHFAKECRASRSKEGQFRNQDNTRKQGNNEDTSKAMLAIDGVDSEIPLRPQLSHNRKNEVLFSEEVDVLKREVGVKQYEINMLKTEFEKVKQEKDAIDFKIEKFDKASKDLDHLLGKFKDTEFKGKEEQVSQKNNDAPIIEDWVSHDEEQDESKTKLEKKTIIPIAAKIEKLVKKSVRTPVNTVRPRVVNTARPNRTSVNAARTNGFNVGKPQLNDKGFVDSGCSRHMTGNIAYLSDFTQFDGGYVAFRGGAYGGKISS
ncbi:putative ribonuclease H-like domain-containing protein [Tanacetum coccineum]